MQVDHAHPLAQLLAQRIAVAGHGGRIIEPLDDQKRGCPCGPPRVEQNVQACREMRNVNRGPAFDRRENARIGGGRESTRAHFRDAVASVHLDLTGIAKADAERRRGRDETAGRERDDLTDERRPVGRQATGDPIAERVTDEMCRTTIQCFEDPGYIGRQIVKRGVFQRTATLSDAPHIDTDGLEPVGNEGACEIVEVTDAAARIREKDDGITCPVDGAFEFGAAHFDDSILSQSHLRNPCLQVDGRNSVSEGRLLAKIGLHPPNGLGWESEAGIIVLMSLDFAECDRARVARNPVYDGRFYTGVHTTGIYCRPVCPVRPARSANVSFFPSAAAAEAAGFRPCLRCRPETAPFCSAWIGSRATVERALRLIVEEGVLDAEGATVEHLAVRLGVGARQLTRLFARYLHASPSSVARTARVQRAKRLLDETGLSMTRIAMQAGFGSLRRFNSVFAEVYGRPPTEIRRRRRSATSEVKTIGRAGNSERPRIDR